jgi:hypothetical protein
LVTAFDQVKTLEALATQIIQSTQGLITENKGEKK